MQDQRIQQVCQVDSHLERIAASIDTKNCGALPLLKAAHALAARYLDYEFYDPKVSPIEMEKEEALKTGKADCSYFAGFTHSNFLYLADKFKRPELKDKVRLCGGYIYDLPHAWLQVHLDNEWHDYGTTIDPFGDGDRINFWLLQWQLPTRVVLRNKKDYCAFDYVQHKKGRLVSYPNLWASVKSGRDMKNGLFRKFRRMYKYIQHKIWD